MSPCPATAFPLTHGSKCGNNRYYCATQLQCPGVTVLVTSYLLWLSQKSLDKKCYLKLT